MHSRLTLMAGNFNSPARSAIYFPLHYDSTFLFFSRYHLVQLVDLTTSLTLVLSMTPTAWLMKQIWQASQLAFILRKDFASDNLS